MSYDLEGNRGSGVALAMRHRLQRLICLRTESLRKVDDQLSIPRALLYGLWFLFAFVF